MARCKCDNCSRWNDIRMLVPQNGMIGTYYVGFECQCGREIIFGEGYDTKEKARSIAKEMPPQVSYRIKLHRRIPAEVCV